jgi:integrase
MHRINDTLSSAVSWGIKRESAFAKNWAQFVELPSVTRPKPLVWTSERIEHWKRTGEKPGPVIVWTPQLTGEFLDFVTEDWLYELWHTFIFLGPRRGEMAALPWTEVSTDALWLRISQQIVEVAYKLYGEAPKADNVRTLSLSLESGDNLVTVSAKQDRMRREGGAAYVESGRVWTHENGEELHPDWISRRFARLVELSGLPPVRLHDLRHLAATLSLLAGHDIKVVQEKLGHSSRQITSDTYTSVLPEMMRAEALPETVHTLWHPYGVYAVCAVNVDGVQLLASASGGPDGRVHLWDPTTGERSGHQWRASTAVLAMCSLHIGKQSVIAAATIDGETWLWDAATGQRVHDPEEPGLRHTSAINALCTVEHAGRTLLVTASSDRTVCLWDPATATRVMEVPVRHVGLGVAWHKGLLAVGLDRGLQVLSFNLPS